MSDFKLRRLNEEFNPFEEEDWEENLEENEPEYEFLLNMLKFTNDNSKTGKNTRKFLRMSYDLVDKGEISEKTLNLFIENENIDEKIVREIKNKTKPNRKKPMKSTDSFDPRHYYDPCGGGNNYRKSSC